MSKKKPRKPYDYDNKQTPMTTIVNKLKKTFGNEEEVFQAVLAEYRTKYLPPEYNQLELLNKLTDDSIDHYISITTRGDGKSFNYISALGYIGYYLDMPTILLVRHWSLQNAMHDLVNTVLQTIGWCKDAKIAWQTNTDYLICYVNDKPVYLVTDLNRASDLKQHSAVLKDFPIILYDEFLTLASDYVDEEYSKMATIYKSVDRVKDRPYIKYPKCIYLGNPVNFSSPLLPSLNIYDYLQTHEIGTVKQYNNVLLEMKKNEHRNDGKNLRAFHDPNDSDVTGEFKFDNYMLTTPQGYIQAMSGGEKIKIRIDPLTMYTILRSKGRYVLGIEKADNDEQYTLSLNDCNENRILLTERNMKDNLYKRFEKGMFQFKDAFSKEYITIHPELQRINFYKLFSKKSIEITHEEVYNEAIKEKELKALYERFML